MESPAISVASTEIKVMAGDSTFRKCLGTCSEAAKGCEFITMAFPVGPPNRGSQSLSRLCEPLTATTRIPLVVASLIGVSTSPRPP